MSKRLVSFPKQVRGLQGTIDHFNDIKYPDDEFDVAGNLIVDGKSFFQGCFEKEQDLMVGQYTGNLPLDDYVIAPDKNIYKPLLSFTDLLTEDEFGALLEVAESARQAKVFWEDARIRDYIDFNEPKPVALLNYLVQNNNIPEWTAPRAQELIGG